MKTFFSIIVIAVLAACAAQGPNFMDDINECLDDDRDVIIEAGIDGADPLVTCF